MGSEKPQLFPVQTVEEKYGISWYQHTAVFATAVHVQLKGKLCFLTNLVSDIKSLVSTRRSISHKTHALQMQFSVPHCQGRLWTSDVVMPMVKYHLANPSIICPLLSNVQREQNSLIELQLSEEQNKSIKVRESKVFKENNC